MSLFGSLQDSRALASPAATETTGAAGAWVTGSPVGVAFTSSDGTPLPPAFTARTWNPYSVCAASPVTV